VGSASPKRTPKRYRVRAISTIDGTYSNTYPTWLFAAARCLIL